MNPFAYLNFPVQQLRPDFELPRGSSKTESVIYYKADDAKRMFTPEFNSLLEGANLTVLNTLIFYQKPNFQTQRIHIDNLQSKTSLLTFTINWIFCEGDCITRWFKGIEIDGVEYTGFRTINNIHEKVADDVRGGSPGYEIVQFDEDKVVPWIGTHDKGPLLLHTSIPHRGINLSNFERWSVSLRFSHDFRKFEEVLNVFKEWKVDDRPHKI